MKKRNTIDLDEDSELWIYSFMNASGATLNQTVNYLIELGIAEHERIAEKERKKEIHVENDLNFMTVKMFYKKPREPEPVEYSIKIKELYVKDGLHYLKAIKEGERRVKAFRVDRIESMQLGDMKIDNPLKFLLEGEISVQ